ncbi:MAG: DUF3997 domain-containing protein [Parafilimonas sp.]|nr:DUF3997 domain-containing protein [Parafilimonas sp.]
MANKKIYTFFGLLIFLLSSCFGLFDSKADKIIGRYNVGWIDIISSRSVDLATEDGELGGIPLVPAYVYGVGHNKKFIIVKQHPVINHNEIIDTKKTNYFIIDIAKDNYKKEGVYGPLTEIQFDSVLIKLNVGGIEFNMSYPDKP